MRYYANDITSLSLNGHEILAEDGLIEVDHPMDIALLEQFIRDGKLVPVDELALAAGKGVTNWQIGTDGNIEARNTVLRQNILSSTVIESDKIVAPGAEVTATEPPDGSPKESTPVTATETPDGSSKESAAKEAPTKEPTKAAAGHETTKSKK